MFRNYLKMGWRNLLKSKLYSAINITGLAAGMAVALLIGLWIWDELSFNRHFRHYDRLAQVMVNATVNGTTYTNPTVSIPMGYELQHRYAADFRHIALASWNDPHIVSAGDQKVSQPGRYVQPGFPQMLDLTMLQGSQDALKDPTSVLLSASLAKSLFGNTDPLNKTVRVDNIKDYKVAGVYEDLPRSTSFTDSKLLLPWEQYVAIDWLKRAETQWDNHLCQLYVQLNDHADIDRVNARIRSIPTPHIKSNLEELMLHPMRKWRLYNEFRNGKVVGGPIRFVWLFGIIGVFVLLLACINFMNLSTARSEKRSKEVGIRKAIGSLRSQLVGQFLSESLLVALLSFVLAMVLVQLSLPYFNRLANKDTAVPWGMPWFWTLALGFTIVTGLLAGSYPAFYLSAFEPVRVLKGAFRAGRLAALPRKVLVVLQFTVSVTLITGTIIVFRQIQHAKDRPVGYTREGLITVDINTPDLAGHYDALRNALLASGAVADMAESNSAPTQIWSNNIEFDWPGKDPNFVPNFGTIAVSHDFGNTVGWTIKAGRDFSRSFSSDTGAFILNEAAVKLTGMKDPVGQIMKWGNEPHKVIGVVKDMVMRSPYEPAYPTIFHLQPGWASLIVIRIKPEMPMREALARIGAVFGRHNPGSPFVYKFTDEEYARKFADEERIGHLSTVFALLAVFISCLGLFGLATFMAEQRTKEIGVRKVLGASVFHLWRLLSKDFAALVLISCFIAVPLAWYVLDLWLQRYTYRTEISWWIFVLTGLGALLITLLTVSYQTIKAALMNPVKSLRSE